MKKVNWFDRGRDARSEGKPCIITDARISGVDRQNFYDGWHHQARLNAKLQLTDEQKAEIEAGFAAIRSALGTLPR